MPDWESRSKSAPGFYYPTGVPFHPSHHYFSVFHLKEYILGEVGGGLGRSRRGLGEVGGCFGGFRGAGGGFNLAGITSGDRIGGLSKKIG